MQGTEENPNLARFNSRATEWDQAPERVSRARVIAGRILEQGLVHPQAEVLDIGCGTGLLSLEIQDQALRVTALDLAPRMVEALKEKCAQQSVTNVEPVVADVRDHTDHGSPWCIFGVTRRFQSLTDRILVRPVLPGKCAADHNYKSVAGAVVRAEATAGNDWNSKGLEIRRGDRAPLRPPFVEVGCRLELDGGRTGPADKGQAIARCHRQHRRYGRNTLLDPPDCEHQLLLLRWTSRLLGGGLSCRCRVPSQGYDQVKRQDLLCCESLFDRGQADKALDQ